MLMDHSESGYTLTLRTTAMPKDANYEGDIFGGWLMAQMDLAGGKFAYQKARGRVATVGVTAMSFHLPVYVGDEISCFCKMTGFGHTSVTVHVETWVRRHTPTGEVLKVTEGTFTFVAIDDFGKKRPLPDDLYLPR